MNIFKRISLKHTKRKQEIKRLEMELKRWTEFFYSSCYDSRVISPEQNTFGRLYLIAKRQQELLKEL